MHCGKQAAVFMLILVSSRSVKTQGKAVNFALGQKGQNEPRNAGDIVENREAYFCDSRSTYNFICDFKSCNKHYKK